MTDKDREFVSKLVEGTKNGRVKWEPTAIENQFTVSFRGKFNVLVQRIEPSTFAFAMRDPNDREMFQTTIDRDELSQRDYQVTLDYQSLSDLFFTAQRVAFSTDEAIDEILGDIEKK